MVINISYIHLLCLGATSLPDGSHWLEIEHPRTRPESELPGLLKMRETKEQLNKYKEERDDPDSDNEDISRRRPDDRDVFDPYWRDRYRSPPRDRDCDRYRSPPRDYDRRRFTPPPFDPYAQPFDRPPFPGDRPLGPRAYERSPPRNLPLGPMRTDPIPAMNNSSSAGNNLFASVQQPQPETTGMPILEAETLRSIVQNFQKGQNLANIQKAPVTYSSHAAAGTSMPSAPASSSGPHPEPPVAYRAPPPDVPSTVAKLTVPHEPDPPPGTSRGKRAFSPFGRDMKKK